MDIFKIVAIGLSGGIAALFLKNYKSEYAVLISLVTAAVILLYVSDSIAALSEQMRILTEKSGVDIKYFKIVIKVVGVAYITQFAGELLRDAGEGAIASKIELAGKIFILCLTMPVITSFLEVCIEAVSYI